MLHSLVFALCLLCFLWQSRSVQCRSTGRESEYNSQENPEGRCLQYCLQKTSSHHTCLEKCKNARFKGENMVFHDKNSSISGNTVLNPLSRIRRKRSLIGDDTSSLCPENDNDTVKNNFATIRTPVVKQYEDSDRWYVNITWDPIKVEGLANFTGYAFIYWYSGLISPNKYIKRQKNETYVVFNESVSGWSHKEKLFFAVIALPCLTGTFPLKKGLDSYLKATPADTAPSSKEKMPTTGLDSYLKTTPADTAPSSTKEKMPTTATGSPAPAKGTAMRVAILASVATIGSLIIIIGIGYLFHQRKHLPSSKIVEMVPLTDFCYDAFIIFNNKDQSWVDGTLLPILEVKHGLKCCVHYRDFEPGRPFVDNMTDSVQNSRNTIAVVSENFFNSEYCQFELEQAIYKHVTDGYSRAIVIRIDDVSKDKLPDALKNKSFVDYSNLIERKTWHLKLIKVLTSSVRHE